MDLNNYSYEIQNFIYRVEQRRERYGYVDEQTCQRFLEYAADANSIWLSGKGYYYFAEYYLHEEEYTKTMHCLRESTKYFLSERMYEDLARTYFLMAETSERMGSSLFALNYFYTGLGYAKDSEDYLTLAKAHEKTGFILLCMNRYQQSEEQFDLAIQCYKKMQDDDKLVNRQVTCLVYKGFNHILLGESESAGIALESLEALRNVKTKDAPAFRYGKMLEAFYHKSIGEEEHAENVADELENLFRDPELVGYLLDAVVPVIIMLDHFKLYSRLQKLIAILDERGLEDKENIYLALYPYKSRYLLETNQTEEYIAYTKSYFEVYDRQLLDSIQVMAQILELQDELREMESKQRKTKDFNRQLEGIALFDVLTGLPNRARLNEFLSECFEEAVENEKLIGIEILDVDFFKEYNDMHGHLEGDKCLEAVASVLREVESKYSFCARYGGDEFVLVYHDATPEQIEKIVERIQNEVRALRIPMGEALPGENASVSQGVFLHVPGEDDREWDFAARADQCLYEAKRGGRDRYYISTEYDRK